MPGPKVTSIELSPAVRKELERMVKGHKTEQQIAKRSQIILPASPMLPDPMPPSGKLIWLVLAPR